MKILDGKKLAAEIRSDIKDKIAKARGTMRMVRAPRLDIIMVGDNEASMMYVRSKQKACEECGIEAVVHYYSQNVSKSLILEEIHALNLNPRVDGIMVQLPLPKDLDTNEIVQSIAPEKDVDCLTSLNYGLLGTDKERFVPATPMGIRTLLKHYKIPVSGKRVVIIGRSRIVGRPLATMLTSMDATVTLMHSQSTDIAQECRRADIIISAVGKPKFIENHMMSDYAVVIDAGISKVLVDGKWKVVGDVDFENVASHCPKITPVPGGVGPMTIASLLQNTYNAYSSKLFV